LGKIDNTFTLKLTRIWGSVQTNDAKIHDVAVTTTVRSGLTQEEAQGVRALVDEKEHLQSQLGVAEKSISALDTYIVSITSKDVAIDVALHALTSYREQKVQLESEARSLRKQLSKVEDEIRDHENQEGAEAKLSKTASVGLFNSEEQTGTRRLTLNYTVNSASWTAAYVARVSTQPSEGQSPVKLEYKVRLPLLSAALPLAWLIGKTQIYRPK
jgi:hypothetical protein